MEKNKIALFNEYNQSDSDKQRYACTIFAIASALKYNTGFTLDEKNDINKIIDKQIAKGQLDIKKGAKVVDSINGVKLYLKEKYNKDLKFITFSSKDRKKLDELLDLGYMITIGIKVDKDFSNDVKDGKINETNYFNFTNGDKIGHFLNLAKWKGRFCDGCEELEDYNQLMLVDNYAFNSLGRQWVYSNIDLAQLPIISQNYYYCFYF